MSEWVEIRQGYPCEYKSWVGKEVLVYGPSQDSEEFVIGMAEVTESEWGVSLYAYLDMSPTHWQPLPEPPKQD